MTATATAADLRAQAARLEAEAKSLRFRARALAGELTYAKAGVTPGWQHLDVIDVATGEPVQAVLEVNTAEGWLVRLNREAGGWPRKGERPTERLTGTYRLQPTRR